jgi:N-acetylneuraminic acid mutarotase
MAGWTQAASLPGGARQELAVVGLGGQLYVIGGLDMNGGILARVERYDPQANRWMEVAPLPRAMHHVNAGVVNGQIVVAGGLVTGFAAVGNVYLYDPGANAWTSGPSLPAGEERGAGAVGVIGERLYLAGGFRGDQSVADFSALEGGAWTRLADLPAKRDHLMAAVSGAKLYVIGGRDNGALTGRVDIWDGSAWSSGAAMPTPRAASAAGLLGNEIFVAGGEGNSATPNGIFVEVEAYDVGANSWRSLAPMRTPRHGTGGGVIADRLWVPGGALVAGFGATSVVESFAP